MRPIDTVQPFRKLNFARLIFLTSWPFLLPARKTNYQKVNLQGIGRQFHNISALTGERREACRRCVAYNVPATRALLSAGEAGAPTAKAA